MGYAPKLVVNGAINDSEIPTHIACSFLGIKGPASRAKCNVLEDFGLTLHAARDFYSHTNWTDAKLPGQGAPDTPPGLGNFGAAPWLDMHTPPRGSATSRLDIRLFRTISVANEAWGCNDGVSGLPRQASVAE